MNSKKQLNIHVMIQARMGSSRLPEKVLLPLGDTTVLGVMIDRVKRSNLATKVMLLTSDMPQDDAIVEFGIQHAVDVFRGSESDLIQRYRGAADQENTDVIVRLTGDCPFMDPEIIDKMLRIFIFNWPRIEFFTNCFQRTFARGVDIEIFSRDLLRRLDSICDNPYYREHVVPYVEENTEEFNFLEYPNMSDDSDYRLTVDTEEDYETIHSVYSLFNNSTFVYEELIESIRRNEHLLLNKDVMHKSYQE